MDYKVVEDKYVVATRKNSKGKLTIEKMEKAFEESWNFKLSMWRLFFLYIFSSKRTKKRLVWHIEGIMKYALVHANSYRGHGASDVIIAQSDDKFYKMWVKEKADEPTL